MRLFVLRRNALRGTYTLLLACKMPFEVRIGKLGLTNIKRGTYLYTGSALGSGAVSLEQRISRHRRRNKLVRWHVDYLTVRPEVIVEKVIYIESDKRLECHINQRIVSNLKAKPIIRRAGASDCNCIGHLLSVKSHNPRAIITRLKEIYSMHGDPLFLN